MSTADRLGDQEREDLAELALMLRNAKDAKERAEIRKTMAEILDPSRIGKLIWVKRPRRRRK